MLIEFTRKGSRRVIDPYEWSRENGHVCAVDDGELLKELFTNPVYNDDFAVAAEEPLLQIVGNGHQVQMLAVYAGVTGVEVLAHLPEAEAKKLAGTMLVTVRTMNSWIGSARRLVGAQDKPEAEETAVSLPDEPEMEVE